MKITIPYIYTAEVIPPRCHKPRLVEQQAKVTLTIHEVTDQEAPVAIIEHDREYDESGTHPRITAYRWYKNKLYIQNKFQRFSHAPWETQTDLQFKTDPYPFRLDKPASFSDLKYKSQKERKIEFIRWAKTILFIDGERWVTTEEPRYVIMTFGLGHNHGIGYGTFLSTDNSYNSNISKGWYFRIDEFDKAVFMATEIALRRGDTKALPILDQDPVRFDILIPEAVRLNPKNEHGEGCIFINECERIIENHEDPMLAGLSILKLVL